MDTLSTEIIKKAELEVWAEDDRFAAVFPTWVVSLIKAEAGNRLLNCDFPTNDEVFAHGYDGSITMEKSAYNIPSGKSVWELGKDEDERDKAKKEYLRVLENLGDSAKECTFVFVTLRSFRIRRKNLNERFNERTKLDWENARNEEGHFKAVKIIDERVLRDWSDKHLDVGLSIKKIFVPDFSYQNIELPATSVAKYLAGFANEKIDETILFCGREKLVQKVRDFQTDGDLLEIFASSESEALAFAAAALKSREAETSVWLPALVIKDAAALKGFHNYQGKTFIISSDAAEEAYGVQADNNVIVCHSLDRRNIHHQNVLRDPQQEVLKKALEKREIEDADKIAGMAGGSIGCLRRLLGGDKALPAYMAAEEDNLECIVFATLLGGWNESDKVTFEEKLVSLDKLLIEENLPEGISFRQFKTNLNAHIDKGEAQTASDVLLKRIDRSFLVKAPVDAIDNILGFMEPEHFETFEKILIKVFSGKNEIPKDPNSPLDTGHFYSTELQTGLALNFCILACRGVERRTEFCGSPAQDWINRVFEKLNREVDFIDFINGKAGLLSYFAEAAPDAFMEALEECLQGNEDGIKWLLTICEDEFSFTGENRATGLMWALQRLAWNQDYFERIVRAIVELNDLDPDPNANMHPRPSSVFQQLFVTFAPQTSVGWEERIRIISDLPTDKNRSLFLLIAATLPKPHVSVSQNSKPIFGHFHQPRITNKDYYDANEAMFECALSRTDGEASRIGLLIDSLAQMNALVFEKAVPQLRNEVVALKSEETKRLWEQLRGLIVRHSRFPDADWSMSEERLKILSEWRDEIQPSRDDWARYLFSQAYIQDFDIEDIVADNKLETERIDTVTQILEAKGLNKFLEFTKSVREQIYLGLATAKASKSIEKQIELARKALTRKDISEPFLRGCSLSAYTEYGEVWLDWLFSGEAVNNFPDQIVKMLACLRIEEAISIRVNSSNLPDNLSEAYWRDVYINFWPRDKVKLRDIEQLLKHSRQAEVLSVLSLYLEKQDDDVLKALTVGIYESMNALPKEEIHQGIIRNVLQLLKLCRERELFPVEELVRYEVPIVKHVRFSDQKYPLAIHEIATSNADTFIEILALAYKTSKPHPAQNPSSNDEEQKHQWETGYHILETMHHPKLEKGEKPEDQQLENWIIQVREASQEYGLEEIADYKVGEVLAMAAADENDGIWPREEVRHVIETLSSKSLLNGIQIKQFNERGVFSDGYTFYNQLADNFEQDAAKLNNWPNTQKFLRDLAKSDRRNANDSKKRTDQYNAMPKL